MKILRPPQGIFCLSLSVMWVTFGLSSFGSAQTTYEIVQDEPFAYWTMNETGPGAATNIGTDQTESADFPDNGQIEFGAPGIADPNYFGVRFNGYDEDSETAGFLDIANSTNTNTGGPWLQKTVEIWFSVDDADSDTEQVLYEQGGSTRGMALYVRGGEVFVGGHNSNGDGGGVAAPWPAGALSAGENELAFVNTEIESNTPYQVALVYDGDADGFEGTISGYLNGEKFGEVDGIGTWFAHTDPIRVGGVAGQSHFDPDFSGDTPYGNDGDPPVAQSPYFFNGVIDDIALFDTALPAERIKAHYDARDYVAGDFDGNGEVDLADFTTFAGNFNAEGQYPQGDMDFNGVIDIHDFVRWRNAFNAPAPAGAAAVPEPSSLMLCLSALVALWCRRRHR